MGRVLEAIYENGVLRPLEEPGLVESQKVQLELLDTPFDSDTRFQRALAQLKTAREELRSSYPDLVRREHAWRSFKQLANEPLWATVEDLEDDTYRRQLADVLDAAVAGLQAFQLDKKHLSALDLTLSCLSEASITERNVDACENAWRHAGVDTLPSLKESFEEWLASSAADLEHAS